MGIRRLIAGSAVAVGLAAALTGLSGPVAQAETGTTAGPSGICSYQNGGSSDPVYRDKSVSSPVVGHLAPYEYVFVSCGGSVTGNWYTCSSGKRSNVWTNVRGVTSGAYGWRTSC
ncbi:hypothetical protein EV193_101838 [Herbihabitans rhizosphaerae]|uniref:Peptidase inhibitor family I36 n=1 Tax=Herbihabitans rhizosphaerae TaxID=1872711 RepID=A0A4Q7L6I3_9PSEU|nr:hypothetical protein [Herbihabitans rhizosphaerae]RZS44957.1 hypothetical protein EV193_101838 [Herbihabitans rhizosphaerae]